MLDIESGPLASQRVRGALSHVRLWMKFTRAYPHFCQCMCAHVCVRARASAQLFHLSERLRFTRCDGCQCLQSQLCFCTNPLSSAHSRWHAMYVCVWSDSAQKAESGLGEVALGSRMLWVGFGNYRDLFGFPRTGPAQSEPAGCERRGSTEPSCQDE